MGGRFVDVWSESWLGIWVPFTNELENPGVVVGAIIEDVFRPPRHPSEPVPREGIPRDADGSIIDAEFMQELESYRLKVDQHRDAVARYIDATSGRSSTAWLKQALETPRNEREFLTLLSGASRFLIEQYEDDAGPIFLRVLRQFVDRFGLGYSVTAQGSIILNQLGMFSGILKESYKIIEGDEYLMSRLQDIEEALDDVSRSRPHSAGRIKTLLSKCISLLEAFGVRNSTLTGTTMSAMVRHLNLPHPTLANLITTLYGFRGDFPGMAHGGNPDGMSRELEIRDMLVLAVVITALAPYFLERFDPQQCYDGSHEAA